MCACACVLGFKGSPGVLKAPNTTTTLLLFRFGLLLSR